MRWFLCVRVTTWRGCPHWKTNWGPGQGGTLYKIHLFHHSFINYSNKESEVRKALQYFNNMVNLKKILNYSRTFIVLCNEMWNETMEIISITHRFNDFLKAKNLEVVELKDTFL